MISVFALRRILSALSLIQFASRVISFPVDFSQLTPFTTRDATGNASFACAQTGLGLGVHGDAVYVRVPMGPSIEVGAYHMWRLRLRRVGRDDGRGWAGAGTMKSEDESEVLEARSKPESSDIGEVDRSLLGMKLLNGNNRSEVSTMSG